jgi:hypothetical protein
MFNKITSLFILVFSLSLLLVSCSDSDPVAPSEEHFEAVGFIILDEDGNVIFKQLKGQIDNDISSGFSVLLASGEMHYNIEFLDEDGNDIGVPGEDDHNHNEAMIETIIESEDDHTLSFESEDNTLFELEIEGWEMHINPLKVGTTNFRVQILHEGHPDFTSPFFPMEVK